MFCNIHSHNHKHTHEQIHPPKHTHTQSNTHTRTNIHTHTHTLKHTHTHTQTHTPKHTHTHTHTHSQIYTHTQLNTHTQIHTHTNIHIFKSKQKWLITEVPFSSVEPLYPSPNTLTTCWEIIIMSRHQHGYTWPSPATLLYRPSLPVGLPGYILYRHRAVVCRFSLVVLPLLVHMKCPLEYVTYEFVPTSPAVSCMSSLSNLDSLCDGW